ncbi:MAG: mechanosensitive ion channel family protein [Candidatus Thermoplasmatota archaeon]|nr:mechanosensitive ion channel family protein [Candidatus Thermoplasmatota archaeon]
MRYMKLVTILLIMSVLAVALATFSPSASATPGDLHVFPPAVTSMNATMDSTAVYRWGIYNNGTNPHTVLLDIRDGDMGWEASFSNEDSYVLIPPGEFVRVELIVTVPNTRDYPIATFNVTATVRDLVTETLWTKEFGTVTTSIIGGAYIPPTKVLGWFDDPLGNFIPELDNEWGVFLTTVTVWLLIGILIYFILDPVVKQVTKKTKSNLDDNILAIIKGPIFWIVFTYGIVSSLGVLNLKWIYINSLNILFRSLLILLSGWMAYRIFKDILLYWGKKYSEKTKTTVDDVMLPLFEKLGMVVIVIVAVILTLNLFGVDVTMLVAGMGVMGLVIAFAAQDTLGNFISGMFLLTDRPFKIGDIILMENGDYCKVQQIGMRSTKLYNTFDHDMIILPNSKIANEKVINLTEPDNKMKVRITVGVDYSTDIQKAKQIMLDAARDHKDVIHEEDKLPFARLIDFGDSAVMLKLYTWVYNLDDQWRVGGELREEIFKRFKKEGISIPFPQRVVHIRNDD